MKNCAGFLLILLLISCNYNHKKDLPNIRGVFNMLSASSADTTIAKQKQLKIYANDCFMYLRIHPADSVSAFGIGTYTTDAGKVTENILYSAADTTVNTTAFSRTFNITKNDKGFEQTIPVTIAVNKKKQVIEEYASVGTTQKSPLDGAWKQTAEYSIKGNDTTKLFDEMQWKIFFGGYWAAGLVFTDSVQKKHTGIIYGKFTTESNKKIKENVSAATLSVFMGHVFDVSIDIKNNDSFSQVLTAPNGTKFLEEFIRVKKQLNDKDDPVERYALPREEKIEWAFHILPDAKDGYKFGTVKPEFNKRGGGKECYFENGTSFGTFKKQTAYGIFYP